MNFPKVYYCKKCDRFTDVRYIADKLGGRNKSYCYKCSDEMLESCRVAIINEKDEIILELCSHIIKDAKPDDLIVYALIENNRIKKMRYNIKGNFHINR